jgi:hypothetical protein
MRFTFDESTAQVACLQRDYHYRYRRLGHPGATRRSTGGRLADGERGGRRGFALPEVAGSVPQRSRIPSTDSSLRD